MPREVAEKLAEMGSPLAEFAVLDAEGCRTLLRQEWSGLTFAPARALAEYYLSLPSLQLCACGKEYWLRAADDTVRLWIETGRPRPLPTLDFPVDAIPGLREMLTYFGGLTNWGFAPGSHWVTAADVRIMDATDEGACWGEVEEWHGSLVVYQGLSADVVILHPSGRTGNWRHEFAFGSSAAEREMLENMSRRMIRKRALELPPEERARFEEEKLKEALDLASDFDQPAIVDLQKDFTGLVESYLEWCKVKLGEAEDVTFYY